MKFIGRLLAILVVLIAVILVGIQIFGVKYLKKSVDKFVLPQVEEITGVDVVVKDLTLNLFKGIVNVEGVTLGNPKGYEGDLLNIGEFKVDVELKSLLKKEVYINNLSLTDVHFSVISKGVEKINVMEVVKHIDRVSETTVKKTKPDQKGGIDAPQDVVAPSHVEVKEPVRFSLEKAGCDFLFSFVLLPGEYIKKEYKLDWNLIVEAKDITNLKKESRPGSIKIQSGLARKESEPQVNIDGIVYPLTDMSKPSFVISGGIANFNMLEVQEWCEFTGLGSDNLAIKLNLICEKGVFQNRSNIEFIFENPKLYGYLSKEVGDVTLPNNISVKVPVKGAWDDPKIDIKPVITKVVFDITKSGLINKYVPEEYKESVKEAGETIEKGLRKLLK